ncbi:MAG TPA: hypothetical protein VFI70_04575 [Nitrososphaeraceae archaeon]|nr:hypothetical protein [Nitrososphaeraceae archaeon]
MNEQDLRYKLNHGMVFYDTAVMMLGWSDYMIKLEHGHYYQIDMSTHAIMVFPGEPVYFFKNPSNNEFIQIIYNNYEKDQVVIIHHSFDLEGLVDLDNNNLEDARTTSIDKLPRINRYIDGHDEVREVLYGKDVNVFGKLIVRKDRSVNGKLKIKSHAGGANPIIRISDLSKRTSRD